jgi:hypothetical protein
MTGPATGAEHPPPSTLFLFNSFLFFFFIYRGFKFTDHEYHEGARRKTSKKSPYIATGRF